MQIERNRWLWQPTAASDEQEPLPARKPWLALGAAAVLGGATAKWFRIGRRKKSQRPERREPAIVRAAAVPRQSGTGQALALAMASLLAAVGRGAIAATQGAIFGRSTSDSLPPAEQSAPSVRSVRAAENRPRREATGGGPLRSQNAPARPRSWWNLLKQTGGNFIADKAPQLGAALAYYTVFSLAPLLVIVLWIVGMVFGQEAAQGQISQQLHQFLGPQGAEGVETMIEYADQPGAGVAGIAGIVALLFGASGVFGQLQTSLNSIWEVEPKPRGVLGMIKDRFWSFAMVLGIGFLLLVSLVVSAALAAVTTFLGNVLPIPEAVAQGLNFVVSFAVIAMLFAMIFKLLPDVEIAWSDVWIGAAFTALLFTIGKFAIGLYLGHSAVSSTYGAAASIVIVLLWAYYSSQILFLGAEFTQAYARMYGSRIEPAEDARPLATSSHGTFLTSVAR